MRRRNERRPRQATEGVEKIKAGSRSTSNDNDLAALARRHDFAVRVLAERADGVVVTAFYSNLPAAERKVTRTRDRGLRAELHLVRVEPVGIAPLPLVADLDALAALVSEVAR